MSSPFAAKLLYGRHELRRTLCWADHQPSNRPTRADISPARLGPWVLRIRVVVENIVVGKLADLDGHAPDVLLVRHLAVRAFDGLLLAGQAKCLPKIHVCRRYSRDVLYPAFGPRRWETQPHLSCRRAGLSSISRSVQRRQQFVTLRPGEGDIASMM
jgi:hypothetical protein